MITIVPAIDEHPAAARLAALGLPHVLDAGAIAAPLIVVGLETCAETGRHAAQCRPFCRRHRSQSGQDACRPSARVRPRRNAGERVTVEAAPGAESCTCAPDPPGVHDQKERTCSILC